MFIMVLTKLGYPKTDSVIESLQRDKNLHRIAKEISLLSGIRQVTILERYDVFDLKIDIEKYISDEKIICILDQIKTHPDLQKTNSFIEGYSFEKGECGDKIDK